MKALKFDLAECSATSALIHGKSAQIFRISSACNVDITYLIVYKLFITIEMLMYDFNALECQELQISN